MFKLIVSRCEIFLLLAVVCVLGAATSGTPAIMARASAQPNGPNNSAYNCYTLPIPIPCPSAGIHWVTCANHDCNFRQGDLECIVNNANGNKVHESASSLNGSYTDKCVEMVKSSPFGGQDTCAESEIDCYLVKDCFCDRDKFDESGLRPPCEAGAGVAGLSRVTDHYLDGEPCNI